MVRTHVSLDVVVLEVERVLPDVNADDGDVREERVLVRGRHDLELLRHGVVPEPAPARALDASRRPVHLLLERCGASNRVSNVGPGAVRAGNSGSLSFVSTAVLGFSVRRNRSGDSFGNHVLSKK